MTDDRDLDARLRAGARAFPAALLAMRLAPALLPLPDGRRGHPVGGTPQSQHPQGERETDEVEPGIVLEQDPAPNTELEEGESVDVVVSVGIDQVAVPSVVGRDLQEAQTLITEAGLVVGDITQEASSRPANEVLSTDPSYVAYMPTVVFAGGRYVTVPVHASNGFKLEAEALRRRFGVTLWSCRICSTSAAVSSGSSSSIRATVPATIGAAALVPPKRTYQPSPSTGRFDREAAQAEFWATDAGAF